MEWLDKKTLKSSRGFTYTYYVSTAGARSDAPALLFQHGWPDNARLFAKVARLLRDLKVPHTMIIPDLLGYDGTDKPVSPEAYEFSQMAQDLTEILEAEKISTCVSIGHDWGCALAQRLYSHYPDRVAGLVMLNVPFLVPSKDKFDLEAVNVMTEKAFGYPMYAYWDLLAAPDGPQILGNNVEKLYYGIHQQGATAAKDLFCVRGAIRKFFDAPTDGKDLPLRDYAQDPEFKQAFIERMSRDGFEGPQNWYRAVATNVQDKSESQISAERYKLNVPALYIGATQDAVCRPEMMIPAKQAGLLPDLEEPPMLESGHWITYERPVEVAKLMADWILRKFPQVGWD